LDLGDINKELMNGIFKGFAKDEEVAKFYKAVIEKKNSFNL
jgi:hypothetical protein